MILSWLLIPISSQSSLEELTVENVNLYQKNNCEISIINFLINNQFNTTFKYEFEPKSQINCFGKIQYVEPTENNFVVFIGANLLLTISLQAIIWMTILSFIFPNKKNTSKKNSLNIFLTTLIFSIHLVAEKNFYQSKVLNLNTGIDIENYVFISYILTFYLISFSISYYLPERKEKLILYFPYLFLFNGVLMNTNLNFFSMILVFFGIEHIKTNFNKHKYYMLIYFGLIFYWTQSEKKLYSFFDVDKLNGFLASNNSSLTIFFWSIMVYLCVQGILYLSYSCKDFNLQKIKNNLFNVGALLVIFGIFAALNDFLNLIFYFIFGQNKLSSNSLESTAGNAWRGFSPSAEMIGEFYGLIFLFYFILLLTKKITIIRSDYYFLIIIFIGFFRANNVAALVSLILLSTILLINKFVLIKKRKITLLIILGTIFLITSYFILRINTYAYMGQSIVFEGLSVSNLEIKENNNFQYIERHLIERDFLSILSLFSDRDEISSSLSFLTIQLTNQNNIKYLPNPVAITGTIALFINRAEKWGVFFSKYDPNISNFIFGYGPMNLVNYNFDNNIATNGLILPHSSLLSFLVFCGLFGFLIFTIFTFYLFRRSKSKSKIEKYLIFFLILNYLKSDALLYFPSFVMFSIWVIELFKQVSNESK